MRDLNFVLKSEIFMHRDRQLRTSHLILGVDPMYSTWQAFSQALLVDSQLLSYMDVRHANFLPPSLTTGEARDLVPRYTTTKDQAPTRDESVERVYQSHKQHIPIERNEGQAQAAKQEVAEGEQEAEMVTRRKLITDRFLPGTQPSAQPQQTQAKDCTPPSSTGRQKKKQRVEDQTLRVLSDVPTKTPPQLSGGITIRELESGPQPVA